MCENAWCEIVGRQRDNKQTLHQRHASSLGKLSVKGGQHREGKMLAPADMEGVGNKRQEGPDGTYEVRLTGKYLVLKRPLSEVFIGAAAVEQAWRNGDARREDEVTDGGV